MKSVRGQGTEFLVTVPCKVTDEPTDTETLRKHEQIPEPETAKVIGMVLNPRGRLNCDMSNLNYNVLSITDVTDLAERGRSAHDVLPSPVGNISATKTRPENWSRHGTPSSISPQSSSYAGDSGTESGGLAPADIYVLGRLCRPSLHLHVRAS